MRTQPDPARATVVPYSRFLLWRIRRAYSVGRSDEAMRLLVEFAEVVHGRSERLLDEAQKVKVSK